MVGDKSAWGSILKHHGRPKNIILPYPSAEKFTEGEIQSSKERQKKPLTVGFLCMARFGLLRYCMDLLKGLASCDGINIILIVTAEEQIYVESIVAKIIADNKNITVEYVNLTGTLNRLKLPLRIGRIVKKHQVDIIHDPVGIAFTMGFVVWPWISRTAPLLVTFHDPKPHYGMGRTLWSRFRRFAISTIPNKIVVHGKYNADNAIDYGINSEKIIISQHGLLNQFADFPVCDEEPNTVLFFGQLRPNKGMELIEDIAKTCAKKIKGFKLIVAGKKPDGREFEISGWTARVNKILHKLRMYDYVEIHDGFISDEESAALFHRASVILLPYRDASQSGVLLLAIALEKIVVLSKVGELATTAELYGGGITSHYDAARFSEALVQALTTERHELKKAIIASRQAVAETYSFNAIARNLLAEYQKVFLLEHKRNRKRVQSAISQ